MITKSATIGRVLTAASLLACQAPEPAETAGEVSEISSALFDGVWTDEFDGSVPANPVRVGSLIVCAVRLGDGLWHPGKLHAGRCYYGWGGREYTALEYRVLVNSPTFDWLGNNDPFFFPGVLPGTSVVGSPRGVRGRQLAICRIPQGGTTAIGKVHQGGCHFGWNGREEIHGSFDILINR